MADASNQTAQIQGWIDRLQAGDESARAQLLSTAIARLERLTRKMLRSFPRVKRWEDTDLGELFKSLPRLFLAVLLSVLHGVHL